MSPFYLLNVADEKGQEDSRPLHTCQFLLLRTLDDLAETMPTILQQVKRDVQHGEEDESKAIHNLHIVVFQKSEDMASDDVVVRTLEQFFAERNSSLNDARIRRITIAFHRPGDFADYYTFLAR
jgi:hypothetical protein